MNKALERPATFDDQLQAAMPELRRYARHMTSSASEADDALNDAMESVLTNWRSYRPDGNFVRWCKLTIRSKADWNRRISTRYQHVNIDEAELVAEPAQEKRAGVYCTLRNAAGLKVGGREVVLAALGHTQVAIGKMVGVTGPRVDQRIKAARRELRAAA